MKPFWVYILRCADGSYYTGHTDELEQRLAQHESGAIPGCFTFRRRPVKLVYWQEFASREEALTAEMQIKGWGRKKKEAIGVRFRGLPWLIAIASRHRPIDAPLPSPSTVPRSQARGERSGRTESYAFDRPSAPFVLSVSPMLFRGKQSKDAGLTPRPSVR
jgi:predicted GIY-YIG superfamily endonuclease